MKFLALIPSRYASTRFPGKPLTMINGKSMIQRVYERASTVFDYVCVATDDQKIYDAVINFGGEVVMTGEHSSGTDRCREALVKCEEESGLKFDVVINIQGDEPYIKTEQLNELKECFENPNVELATLVKRISDSKELFNHNTPKVVVDKDGYALYFSRSPIPFPRDVEVADAYVKSTKLFKHIGLYGYRRSALHKICELEPSFLEKTEKLEQLRWLENGLKIKVKETFSDSYAVDTPQDAEYLNSINPV